MLGGSKICKTWPILENNSAFERSHTTLLWRIYRLPDKFHFFKMAGGLKTSIANFSRNLQKNEMTNLVPTVPPFLLYNNTHSVWHAL